MAQQILLNDFSHIFFLFCHSSASNHICGWFFGSYLWKTTSPAIDSNIKFTSIKKEEKKLFLSKWNQISFVIIHFALIAWLCSRSTLSTETELIDNSHSLPVQSRVCFNYMLTYFTMNGMCAHLRGKCVKLCKRATAKRF